MAKGWMDEVAQTVRERRTEVTDFMAAGLKGGFAPTPPPEAPKLSIDQYLKAPPDLRQEYLGALPPEDFTATMERLQSEALDQYGPMASAIMPMLSMEEAAGQVQRAQAQDPMAGVQAANAELADMLGFDPFAP